MAEEEEDRCDQAEDKKPPTEEVREAIMIWPYSKIVFFFYIFLLNFLILNDLGVRGAIASMRVLLVCPSDFAMHWMLDQKDLINLQVRHSVERVLKQVQ